MKANIFMRMEQSIDNMLLITLTLLALFLICIVIYACIDSIIFIVKEWNTPRLIYKSIGLYKYPGVKEKTISVLQILGLVIFTLLFVFFFICIVWITFI